MGAIGDQGPGLLPTQLIEWFLYAVALGILSVSFLLTYRPGSVEFFAVQVVLWCFGSIFICESRRQAWKKVGMDKGGPPGWKEAVPAWAYDSSVICQLVNFPFSYMAARKIFTSHEAFVQASTVMLKDYPETEDLWIEHLIFSSLMGFMLKDMILHIRTPDPLLTAHHVVVCILMICCGFFELPGPRLLSLTTTVVEIGTSSFVLWNVWRCPQIYFWTMTMSNVAFFLMGSFCLYNSPVKTALQCTLWVGVIGLIIGRSTYMVTELREYYAHQKTG